MNACYERASAYNSHFPSPLDDNEVMGITKSIAKWTISRFSKEDFQNYVNRTHSSKIQSIRGSKSKGGGRPNILGTPWVDLGISRSAWYRRNK